jgi:hypothetical protein
MLTNNRTPRLIGLNTYDIISIIAKKGAISLEVPQCINKAKKYSLLTTNPSHVKLRNSVKDKESVTTQ